MKRLLTLLAVSVVMWLVPTPEARCFGEEWDAVGPPVEPAGFHSGYEQKGIAYPPLCADCGVPSMHCVCGCGLIWYGEFETLLLRYDRADGVTSDTTNPDGAFDYSYQLSQRITIGAVWPTGIGLRGRGFHHDHSAANSNGDQLNVNASVLDLEIFENVRVTPVTAVEWSLGARGVDFDESTDPHPLVGSVLTSSQMDGIGIVAGLEINRMLRCGSLYGRGRGALLIGDREIWAPGVGFPHVIQDDVTSGMFELGVGWEFTHTCGNGLILTSGIGWEFQNWFNYSIAPPAALPTTSPVDVGFNGVSFNFAIGW